jgi:hypothetical protein
MNHVVQIIKLASFSVIVAVATYVELYSLGFYYRYELSCKLVLSTCKAQPRRLVKVTLHVYLCMFLHPIGS